MDKPKGRPLQHLADGFVALMALLNIVGAALGRDWILALWALIALTYVVIAYLRGQQAAAWKDIAERWAVR